MSEQQYKVCWVDADGLPPPYEPVATVHGLMHYTGFCWRWHEQPNYNVELRKELAPEWYIRIDARRPALPAAFKLMEQLVFQLERCTPPVDPGGSFDNTIAAAKAWMSAWRSDSYNEELLLADERRERGEE